MIRHRLAVLLLIAVTACVTGTTAAGTRAQRQDAALVVDNQSSSQMTIYALRGPERVRLGDAWALRTTTLRIPASLVMGTSLRFLADPIGSSRAPVSHEITVWPGDTIEITIPPHT